jgi:hypothetical protein
MKVECCAELVDAGPSAENLHMTGILVVVLIQHLFITTSRARTRLCLHSHQDSPNPPGSVVSSFLLGTKQEDPRRGKRGVSRRKKRPGEAQTRIKKKIRHHQPISACSSATDTRSRRSATLCFWHPDAGSRFLGRARRGFLGLAPPVVTLGWRCLGFAVSGRGCCRVRPVVLIRFFLSSLVSFNHIRVIEVARPSSLTHWCSFHSSTDIELGLHRLRAHCREKECVKGICDSAASLSSLPAVLHSKRRDMA